MKASDTSFQDTIGHIQTKASTQRGLTTIPFGVYFNCYKGVVRFFGNSGILPA